MRNRIVMGFVAHAAMIAAACSSGAPGPAGPAGPAEPAASGAAPSVGAAASASSSQPGAAATAPAEIQSELVAVSELPYPIRLLRLGPTLLGVGRDPLEDMTGIPMGIVEGGRFVPKKELTFPGFMAFIIGVAGEWPRGVDMAVTGTTGRTAIAMHYTLTADAGWRPSSSRDGANFTGIALLDGSVVALEAPALFPWFKPEVKTLRGPKITRITAPLEKECARTMIAGGQPPEWLPRTDIIPEALGATRGGTLISIGTRGCAEGSHAEIWDPKSTKSRIVQLPSKLDEKNQNTALVVPGKGDNEAYIIHGGVSFFDGKNISALPEAPARIANAAVANGALYAITESETRFDEKKRAWVATKPPRLIKYDGKSWADVPLPTSPDDIAVDQDGTLWVTSGTTLLRSRKSADEKNQVAIAQKENKPVILNPAAKRVRAAGPLCPSNLVVLYGFTKVTPADYDFPLTRKALKGHTEYDKTRFVVANDGGQKFFSAIVPDVATGRKLVSLIEKEVKGSKPQLLCAEPEIVREMKLDLKTGEVVE
ncbi:MAG: hypothetical protein JNL21_29725 [Myxococcales bacterium]|nr:hypothetical protein [Myxococcales bacterium]